MPAFPAPPFVPSAQTVQRLSFVHYLHQLGVQQSDQPAPMAGAAVLTFHDAVDLFVQLVVETLKIPKPKSAYMMGLLTEIERKLVNPPSHSVAMNRLNDARNGLKHSGLHPARNEIEGFRASVTNFLEDYSQLVFGVRFGTLSMVSLVENVPVRERLQRAEEAMGEGAFDEAALDSSWAFAVLVRDYEDERTDEFGRPAFGTDLRSYVSFGHDSEEFRDLRESIQSLGDQLRLLSLGLDLHRHGAFRRLVPTPYWVPTSREPKFFEGQRHRPASEATCRFCVDFVVDSALLLQGSSRSGKLP